MKPTVIVMSSHVADGAVGNRAAVFALERLGFPVIAVPTVLLTWHPGVGPATRILPPEASFTELVDDLAGSTRLGPVGAILSGYLGEASQAAAIARLVRAVKTSNPEVLYLCDPVIGDAAGPYVATAMIAAIGGELMPLADIATPNRYELSLIGGGAFSDNEGILAAAKAIRVAEVVVTSAFAKPGEATNLIVAQGDAHLISHAALPLAPHGTGDLLSALYLAHRLNRVIPAEALRLAAGTTFRLAEMAAGDGALPLAAGQEALLAPSPAVSVTSLNA